MYYRNVVNKMTVKEFHLSQKFLIILDDVVLNAKKTLNYLFAILWENGLVNSHILCQNESNFWTLYTFMPYQSNCHQLTLLQMITFTPFNFTDYIPLSFEELYPAKLKNFNQCPLFYAPSTCGPYVYTKNTSDGVKVDGIDVSYVKEIARQLQLSVVLMLPKEKIGIIFRNGSATGTFGSVKIVLYRI